MTTKRVNILLALAVSIVCIVMAELCAAFLFEHGKSLTGKRLVKNALKYGGRFTWNRDGYIIPHPYLLYTLNPGYEEYGFTQVNALGYRGHEIPLAKPEGTYRILCLGGSTTFSFPYIQDPSKAWPALLESELNERYPGRRFDVVNAGLPYGTSAEMLAGYMFRHRYLHPDMVIVNEGGNDAAPLFYENYNPEYTHFRSGGVRILTGPIERFLLHSHVFRVFFAYYWRNIPTVYVPEPYGAEDLDRQATLERVQKTYPAGFERNLDLLMRTARADGAKVMLVGFVTPREENMAKNWPWQKGLEHATAIGTRKNLAVMDSLAAVHGAPYLSPSDFHTEDEWFLDGCHLNEEGERAKSEWILGGVVRLLERAP
jgi:lysophospholipase L1-like esterase